MYTLLIVDDEPLSQVGLKSMLDWRELDVEIVGTSPNGLHALEAIALLKPDIVIADVRMPLLDGIGLIERCRAETGGGPEFIVLSGYADFDAARRAMRAAAVDYLVKLELDEAALRASVEKAKAAVRGKRRSGLSPGAGAGRGDPFAETSLTRLLAGAYADAEEARLSLERSGVELAEGPRCVAYFKVGYANSERLLEDERLRAYCCAVDMVKQLVGREASILAVPFDTASFAALLSFPGSSAGAGADIARCAAAAIDRARDITEKYFGVELRAGVGAARAELLRAADSYREAVRAAEAAGPGRRVVRYEELQPQRPPQARADRGLRRAALVAAVAERSAEGLRAVVREAILDLGEDGLAQPEALAICCELLYPILERLDDGEAALDSIFPGETEGWRSLFAATTPGEACAWLERVGEGLCSRFESARSRGRNPLVAGVQKYVRENVSAKLSLGEVAARFEVSPNHLSALFKKYGGIGYSEFVAQAKVEKAKELILDGRYKMFEVAQLLGFEDAFYFSKVFKKVAGISPRDFYLRGGEREPTADPGP